MVSHSFRSGIVVIGVATGLAGGPVTGVATGLAGGPVTGVATGLAGGGPGGPGLTDLALCGG